MDSTIPPNENKINSKHLNQEFDHYSKNKQYYNNSHIITHLLSWVGPQDDQSIENSKTSFPISWSFKMVSQNSTYL